MKPGTPLPWEVETSGDRYVEVMDSETLAITICSVNQKPTRDQQIANAEYIVRSANAYPKLIEALRPLIKALAMDVPEHFANKHATAVTAARALLHDLGEAE